MDIIDYSWDFSREDFNFELNFFDEKEQEDKLWQARTGLNLETLCGAIETIIFMSDRPINIHKIKNYIDAELPLRVVHESIARLQKEYEGKHHGLRLQEVAEGYQFRTKATYSKFIQNIFKVNSLVLSPTALEVLAIIAYKQPVAKHDVESIRGVDSSHIIRALMDKRLVKVVGRSEDLGKPSLFGTTDEFLEVFNLNNLEQLPTESELEELAMTNTVGNIADIRSVVMGDKAKFEFDEFSELEALSESINLIDADTSFTISLKSEEKRRVDDSGIEKKSAFDILEEFVNSAQAIEQNKAASLSDILTNIIEPKVVDLSDEETIFNAPLKEEEEENLDLEAQELSDALDEAFANLTKNNETLAGLEDELELDAELEETLDQLEAQALKLAEEAKEFDLDLNFLQNDLDNPSQES